MKQITSKISLINDRKCKNSQKYFMGLIFLFVYLINFEIKKISKIYTFKNKNGIRNFKDTTSEILLIRPNISGKTNKADRNSDHQLL